MSNNIIYFLSIYVYLLLDWCSRVREVISSGTLVSLEVFYPNNTNNTTTKYIETVDVCVLIESSNSLIHWKTFSI